MPIHGSAMRFAVMAMLPGLLLALGPPGTNAAADGDPFFIQWETIGKTEGLPSDKVLAVLADGPRVWAGTEEGLVMWENGNIRVFDATDGLPFPAVTALAVSASSGDLWIGTMGGLARLSAGRMDVFTQLNSGLANNVIYGVATDGTDVWVATAAGLSRYDTRSGNWELFDTTNTLMHEPWCYGVTAAKGNVYVAVWGGGVVIREPGGRFRQHRDPDGEMEIDLFRDDGLIHDVTSAVSVTDGVMWVGTYFGLSRYDGRRWKTYNQDDSGLAGDFINYLSARDQAVWIATDQGLSRFDSETWHTWRRTDTGSGYQLETTTAGGVQRVQPLLAGPPSNTIFGIDVDHNDIWLATAAGLSHGIARQHAQRIASRPNIQRGQKE